MPKIAVLGAGFMGSTHAKAYKSLPGVDLGSIYAHSPKRAEPLADELGTTWTDDLDCIMSDKTIDAIDICLPTPEHRAAAERAIVAGKHVLLEKPIALSLEDADALVDLGASTDRVFMIAHVLRFWPEYVELQRIAASGRYGRSVSAFASRRQPFPAWSELFSRSELTGGAVIDMMIHDYDTLNWIFGAPKAVAACGINNPRSQGWDQVQVLIEYDGASALVDGGMMMPESYPFSSRLEVLLESGALEYHFQAGGRSVEMGAGVNDLTDYPNNGDPKKLDVPADDPYLTEVAYFVDCITSGQPASRATPEDARLALQVALAAKESLETAKTVLIP